MCVPGTGMAGQPTKSKLFPKQILFLSVTGSTGRKPLSDQQKSVDGLTREGPIPTKPVHLFCKRSYVPDRPVNSHRETGPPRLPKNEAPLRAPHLLKTQESLFKVIPVPSSLHQHLKWWLQEENILVDQSLHPLDHTVQVFADASEEGWGALLK